MSRTLEDLTAPAAAALLVGLGVLVPESVLTEAPEHRYGQLAGLQDHFAAAGAGGPVSGVHLPALGVVALTQPEALDGSGVDPSRVFRVLSAATDPYLVQRAESR